MTAASTTGERRAATDIDIVAESALWKAEAEAETMVRRAIAAAAASRLPAAAAEVSVILTDDAGIRELNRKWRGIDRPTNVLSFPALSWGTHPPVKEDGPPLLLGDIILSYETLAREAQAEDKPFNHHLAHLVAHGFLHLLGYDHDSDEAADTMERLEGEILARLAVPNPYTGHEAKA